MRIVSLLAVCVVLFCLSLHLPRGGSAAREGKKALRKDGAAASDGSPSGLLADFWRSVASCETGQRWDWGSRNRPGEGTTYQGGLGFYWATWDWWATELGLIRKYPHAYDAPANVQILVADHGYRRHRGYWGCFRTVGFPPG
jgi:hypothetical protein